MRVIEGQEEKNRWEIPFKPAAFVHLHVQTEEKVKNNKIIIKQKKKTSCWLVTLHPTNLVPFFFLKSKQKIFQSYFNVYNQAAQARQLTASVLPQLVD